MEVSIIINIGSARNDGYQNVTLFVYPVSDRKVHPSRLLLDKMIRTTDINNEVSVQNWVTDSLLTIVDTIKEDVHDCGYTAVEDLMLDTVKRKPS